MASIAAVTQRSLDGEDDHLLVDYAPWVAVSDLLSRLKIAYREPGNAEALLRPALLFSHHVHIVVLFR